MTYTISVALSVKYRINGIPSWKMWRRSQSTVSLDLHIGLRSLSILPRFKIGGPILRRCFPLGWPMKALLDWWTCINWVRATMEEITVPRSPCFALKTNGAIIGPMFELPRIGELIQQLRSTRGSSRHLISLANSGRTTDTHQLNSMAVEPDSFCCSLKDTMLCNRMKAAWKYVIFSLNLSWSARRLVDRIPAFSMAIPALTREQSIIYSPEHYLLVNPATQLILSVQTHKIQSLLKSKNSEECKFFIIEFACLFVSK